MYNLGQTLYKIDSKGKVREWEIDVIDHSTHASVVTTAGLQNGKKVQTVIDIYEGKNLGKANATTYYTQAVSEALASAELKLRGEYRTDINNVEQQVLRSGIKAPLLAQKYHPTGEQKSSKTLEKIGILGKNVHVQPKLDGVRCLIKLSYLVKLAGSGTMYTRKGDIMPVQIKPILDELMDWWLEISVSGDEVILDGELFSEEMTFNELNGHLKRKDNQDESALSKIKFHLYDVMLEAPYDIRYDYIKGFARNATHVELIPSYKITATDENIREKLEEFLADGHEGLMIRTLDKGYENKRSWQLVKYKVFDDAEYKVIDIEEDARGGIIGAFVMQLPAPTTDRDGKTIDSFRAGVSGMTQEETAHILENKDQYIGKTATVEYFGLSEYGVPRFGKLKAFRD